MRKREGLRPWHLVFVVLLVLPPVARVIHRSLAQSDRAVEEATLRSELTAAHEEARRARTELEARDLSRAAPGLADLEPRHELIEAIALPVSDPSPTRSTLWATVRDHRHAHGFGAALAEGALAGRVLRAFADLGIVKVQTVLDPAFRVRFQQKGASGMLWGTGKAADGYAFLAVHHLSETVSLEPGEPVYTEGNDGVYPGGVLIGFVAEGDVPGTRSRVFVRSAIRVEDARRLVLPVDLASPRLSEALRRDAAEGGLGLAPDPARTGPGGSSP